MPPPEVPGYRSAHLPPLHSQRLEDPSEPHRHDSSQPPRKYSQDELARERAQDAKDQLHHVWQRLDEISAKLNAFDIRLTGFESIATGIQATKTQKFEHKKLIIGLASGLLTAIVVGYFQLRSAMISAAVTQAGGKATNVTQNGLRSTEGAYNNGFADGAKAAVDEQLARLQANPPPIQKALVVKPPKP